MADKGKALYEKHQRILADLLREEENKTCADCGGRGPRWASWNLGVFLCIRCAGIHRNLGVHVSRVKSVNLDSWTPDQISSIQKGGNRKAQLTYEATLPSEYKRPVDDYSVEQFIRNKYIKKSWVSKDPVNGEGKKAVNKQTSPVKSEVKTKQQPQEVKKPSQVKNTLSKPSNPHIGRSTSAPLKPVQPPPVVDLLSDDITLPTTTQQTPDRSKTSSIADQKSSHSASHLNTIQDSHSFFEVPKPACSQPEPMGKDEILSLYSRNQQQQGYNGMGYHPMYAYHHQQMAMVQAQHQMYCAQQQSQISQVQEKMARLKMRQQQETASANGSGTLNPHLWGNASS